jgi:2-C-methyl-D-erythritol 4-phosphate cytidylyltransferase/2-C-methyl-D-erythritol 2,4-cyclodiphosphate synthase
MRAAVLIVAAGRGSRVAGADRPKQYLSLGGRAVLERTVAVFAQHPDIARVSVVIHPDDQPAYMAAVAGIEGPLAPPTIGGATRQVSVLRGLESLVTWAPDVVLIHDAARPFTTAGTIDAVLSGLRRHPGVVAGLRVTDTIKRGDARGLVAETVPRHDLWRAQTPQGFHYAAIAEAHRRAAAAGIIDFTDDAALAEWARLEVAMVEAQGNNMKITTADDVALGEALLGGRGRLVETRTGQGFDVHVFVPGDHVWLCGVRIPHTHRLDGHSDADAALHALTDALLGAIGDGDIGQHFPPSDPKWKGTASHLFLADAVRRVRERGARIVNTDITLLCEAPRISPYRDAMRARIAEILGIEISRIGVKATTTEGLGFTGRREGLAAMAVASVMLPA